MALDQYIRTNDPKRLISDSLLEVTDLFYAPNVEDAEDLSVGDGDADRAGAIATVTEDGVTKIAVYQGGGSWVVIESDTGGPSFTEDPSVPNTGAKSYLNSNYPNARPGDQVYKTAGGMRRTWTCYASGEWSRIDEIIES